MYVRDGESYNAYVNRLRERLHAMEVKLTEPVITELRSVMEAEISALWTELRQLGELESPAKG